MDVAMRKLTVRNQVQPLLRHEPVRPPVSPNYDLKGKRLDAANQAQRTMRSLAGATVLQIVPGLRDDLAGNAVADITQTLVQAGARAIVAGQGGALVGAVRAYGGEWMPLETDQRNPFALRKNARTFRDVI
jgi:hypothetical protein